ncbi:hemicentin-1-like isoform X2 [Melanotaenia boesemani]|uniref:hemicentin-1-like isoform X2 n=1 Tax=Melanotaenia boesemani TaxID=1250792 RepID=UPI001C0511D4|nr:hemicentin-1-like isoform X2 [Melanotaenia boesemani]
MIIKYENTTKKREKKLHNEGRDRKGKRARVVHTEEMRQHDKTLRMFFVIWVVLLFKMRSISPNSDGQQTTEPELHPEDYSSSEPGEVTGNTTENPGQTSTFIPSSKHENATVTCEANCPNNLTVEEAASHNATDVKRFERLSNTITQEVNRNFTNAKQPEITGKTTVTESGALNLTCTVDAYLPSVKSWATHLMNRTFINETGISTLVIHNVSAEHSGLYICTAKYLNNTLTHDLNVTVIYAKQPEITGNTNISEVLNLTCTVDSFPPSVITWTRFVKNKTQFNETESEAGASTLVIHNVTVEHSGQYICTAKYVNNTLTQDMNVTQINWKRPEITGKRDVTEGNVLNLTCTADSWPPSYITWSKLGFNFTLNNGTGAASLVIYNVTADDSGQYICSANRPNKILTQDVNVTVKLLPKILNNSRCEAESDVLTCVCVSQGIPLPTIKWPLLDNHTEYSYNTAVSNHTVTNTITLTVKDHSRSSAVCVSSNGNGETKKELIINKVKKEGQSIISLSSVTQPGIIISFLIGVLLSAVVFGLVKLCCRKKRKTYGNLVEAQEMVTSQHKSQINNSEAVEYAKVQTKRTAEEAEAAGSSDVEYSDVNVLLSERRILGKAEQKQGNSAPEYAEINKLKKRKKSKEFGDRKEEEGLKCCEEDKGSDDGAVYSNVMGLMEQV